MSEAFVSDATLAPDISREVKRGTLRKLASRLYTRNLKDAPERIVQRHLWMLIAAYLPDAIISDRSALENRPAPDGSVFLISDHKRDIELPGVILRPRKGPPPLEGDRAFVGTLRLASPGRAFLENMRLSRARSGVARTLSRKEIEERLDEILRQSGEPALNRIRDQARSVAEALGMTAEFQKLDALMGGLLGTRAASLQSPVAVARSAGMAYDPERLDLFQKLYTELAQTAPVTRVARPGDGDALPFFESYFSNFIEGTEFAVEEAVAIVFQNQIPVNRPADAHDVLGTWRVASDAEEMARIPAIFEQLIALVKRRHAHVMEGRPDRAPGVFKTEVNRAGSTVFVAPELVRGTLAKGFEIYRALSAPLQRAAFIMFVIAEVHPFADGNGRTARLMMNAELVSAGESRIIIPTVYRNNYLAALKALSQNGRPAALLRMLDFAQRYTAAIDFSTVERARYILEATNAFADPNEADAAGIRLIMPGPEVVADAAMR
jgi:fido (protein-threonine AMPylation protein)